MCHNNCRFTVDSTSFDSYQVKFYKASGRLFANVRDVSPFRDGQYAYRISRGKLNLFELSYTGSSGGNPIKREKYYYNKGFDELLKVNYRNLKRESIDNIEFQKHFKKAKSLRTTQIILCTTGAALLGSGIIVNSNSQDDKTVSIVMMSTGVFNLFLSEILSIPKKKNFKRAIIGYNFD